MTGAIPRSLMTDAELAAHDRDAGYGDEYVPTPAGRAYIFTGPAGDAASESTGSDIVSPEGRERPEGDAARTRLTARPGLLARRTLRDEDDTPAARGLVLGLLAGAAMWIAALAIAADLGALR